MSIILDALKKSEAERQQNGAPGLYEARMAPPRQRFSLWLLIVCALLLINAIGLTWVLLRGHGGVTAPPTAAAPVAPTQSAAAPVPAPQQPAPVVPAAAPDVTAPPVEAPPVDAGSAVTRNDGAADADTDDDDAPAVAPSRTTTPVPAAPATAETGGAHVRRVAPPDQALPSGPPPPRSGVPSYQDAAASGGLPELTINLHSWSREPSQRYILLNMTRLREGDTSPQGVKVETITQDGAVLSWQGREFTLQR